MSAASEVIELAKIAGQKVLDKKLGSNIVAIDVSEQLAITDLFLIVSSSSERQVSSCVDAIEEAMISEDRRPARREGQRDNRWVLLDYVDFVVHVQHEEERDLYSLDRLWKDCPIIDLELDAS